MRRVGFPNFLNIGTKYNIVDSLLCAFDINPYSSKSALCTVYYTLSYHHKNSETNTKFILYELQNYFDENELTFVDHN